MCSRRARKFSGLVSHKSAFRATCKREFSFVGSVMPKCPRVLLYIYKICFTVTWLVSLLCGKVWLRTQNYPSECANKSDHCRSGAHILSTAAHQLEYGRSSFLSRFTLWTAVASWTTRNAKAREQLGHAHIRVFVNSLELDKLDPPSGYHRSSQTPTLLCFSMSGSHHWSVTRDLNFLRNVIFPSAPPEITPRCFSSSIIYHIWSTLEPARYLGKNWAILGHFQRVSCGVFRAEPRDEVKCIFPRRRACGAAAPNQNRSHSYQMVFDEEARRYSKDCATPQLLPQLLKT
ncbi:hypothetical protein V8E53_004096 [Lactarius tabidus]